MIDNPKSEKKEDEDEPLFTNAQLFSVIIEAVKQGGDSLKQFIKQKYRADHTNTFAYVLVVFLMLGAIVYLSAINALDRCNTGTLLGSIIGYAFGKFLPSSNSRGGK